MIPEKINYACIIEDKSDFNVMYRKFNSKDNLFIPLGMETFLLCKNHRLNIFDFKKFINNKFHIKAIHETALFSQSLKYKKKLSYSFKSEIAGYLRFRLHSIIFIIELIEKLLENYNINKLVVSGNKKNLHSLHKCKIISEIVENLYPNITLILNNNSSSIIKSELFEYQSTNIYIKKKKILISNGGYNFKRICSFFKKKKYNIYFPTFKKLGLIERLIYFYRGIKTIKFSQNKKKKIQEETFIANINYFYNEKYDLSILLNNFYQKLNFYFNDLNQKIKSLKTFTKKNNFDLLISNIARGLDGSILDSDIKSPSLCIPHGIISDSFNKDDVIYKKIIAEAVMNGESKYFAIQSKIMNESLSTHVLDGKKIITGNLIFSNLYKKSHKKKYFLFATTLKDFTNLQYLGVDMFYEYWSILDELNLISKERKEKFVVKVHPQFKSCTKNLSKNFKFLKFSNKRIDSLLKHATSLISLSSGTIEDALNSKVPVILYDKNKRYKQMKIHKTDEKGTAVHYINEKKQLELALNEIKSCRKFNFNQYIYDYDLNKTLNEKILPLINHEKNN